jgi:hypothetical protein
LNITSSIYKRAIFIILLQIPVVSCQQNDRQFSQTQQENIATLTSTAFEIHDSLVYGTKIEEFRNLLDESFSIEQQSYFVIASNLEPRETDRIIQKTILPAVECFYNDFLKKKPDDITSILLFKNDSTYRYWAKKLYSDDDLSRFGYFKPDVKVMLMNISTGTGTLVHEMTHALVSYDFPEIPAWFNEGLGSLYERCSLSNGIILGYVNWRLPDLQDAIGNNTYTSLESLFKLNDEQFYGEKSGFNYAQARYFCMFLQEKNLLKKFYRTFRDNFSKDQTGRKFILSVLGQNMKEIEKEFINWASSLSEH